jgi:anti-anti-sigma regulatory factor
MSVLPTRVLPAAPATGQLSVTVVPGERPGRAIVEVVGEVTASTVPLLQLCLDSRTDQPDLRELVVDLAQATGLEPDGTAALARARRRCARRGIRLVLRPAGEDRLRPGR